MYVNYQLVTICILPEIYTRYQLKNMSITGFLIKMNEQTGMFVKMLSMSRLNAILYRDHKTVWKGNQLNSTE